MTTYPATASRDWRGALVANSDKIVRFGGLTFVALAGFAGAFRHMHDWTADALPHQADWLCWANAVISEILPTVSFLSWRDRIEQKRPAGVPLLVFLGSAVVSLVANLSATGLRIHGDRYFLAALPMLSIMVLFKMVLGDLDHARKRRERIEELARKKSRTIARRAAHAAELARKKAARDAELQAELARNFAREQAELAAELSRQEAEQAAELARQQAEREAAERLRLAEIEQAATTERDRVLAAERAEVRRIEQARLDAEARARAAAFAEAERIKAEAEAERIAAETRRIAAEAAAHEQATALLAGRHRAAAEGEAAGVDAEVTPIRQRRPRAKTQAIADAVLASLPAGTSRDEAVKAVHLAIGSTQRYAREFVPPGWWSAGSAGGERQPAV